MTKKGDSNNVTEARKSRVSLWRHVGGEEAMLVVFVGLSLFGMALTNASAAYGYKYWLAMIPVFAAGCIYSEWLHGRGQGFEWGHLLRNQLVHWGGLLVAVVLVYSLVETGRLNFEGIGFMIMTMLALTAFHAGIHRGGWRFTAVGIFLGLAVTISAYAEQYHLILLWIGGAVTLASYLVKRFTHTQDE